MFFLSGSGINRSNLTDTCPTVYRDLQLTAMVMQQLALSLALPHSSGCLGRQLWPGLMSKIYFECELKIQGTILPACLADQAMRHYHIKEKCASRDPLGDKRLRS